MSIRRIKKAAKKHIVQYKGRMGGGPRGSTTNTKRMGMGAGQRFGIRAGNGPRKTGRRGGGSR